MYKECKFNLDINNGTANNIRAVQKDDIKLKVKLTNKGKSIDLSRQVITLGVTRHDQQTINQIDGFVGDENGNIEGLLKDGITSVAGISKLQFTFDGSQGQSSTPEFNLILQPKIILNQDGSESGTEGLDEDKIQMYKLTTDSGYAKNKIKDCNECLHNGDYYLASPVKNGFDGENSLFLTVNALNESITMQTAVSESNGKVAIRIQTNKNWGNWIELAKNNHTHKISEVIGLQGELNKLATDTKVDGIKSELNEKINQKQNKTDTIHNNNEIKASINSLKNGKADKSSVDTELNKKADKSYVDMADNTLKSKIDTVESSMNAKWNGKADLNYTQSELSKKADKSVAQMWKLTDDNGSTTRKSADANELLESGWYFLYPAENCPNSARSWLIFTLRGYGNFITQIAKEAYSNTLYHRASKDRGATWFEWRKLATDTDLSKKADINRAQMWKLTADNGECDYLKNISLNDVVNTGLYFIWGSCTDTPKRLLYGSLLVQKTSASVTQFAIDSEKKCSWVRIKDGVNGWSNWQQLATTSDLATVKTDLTKATTVQLASGNNLNDYFDHNGKITGINLVGAPLEMNGHNVIVECSSYTNTGSTQEITDLVTGVKMLRTYTNGRWTRWQKLGGIDAKVKTQENTRIIELEKRIAQLESK